MCPFFEAYGNGAPFVDFIANLKLLSDDKPWVLSRGECPDCKSAGRLEFSILKHCVHPHYIYFARGPSFSWNRVTLNITPCNFVNNLNFKYAYSRFQRDFPWLMKRRHEMMTCDGYNDRKMTYDNQAIVFNGFTSTKPLHG